MMKEKNSPVFYNMTIFDAYELTDSQIELIETQIVIFISQFTQSIHIMYYN
ncbi:MAG: hypothetical protein KatS3mg002_1392 [Candidatus Woesearchaeota archaeon]|nr:MAG: hypothetical protein KatS3mg002_1392 [Candidatus Woesearchaeota archaeon]